MNTEQKTLDGRVALVTGGSRGIGKAISLELARRGANICFNYLRSHAAARAAEEELGAHGVAALRHRANLADDVAIEGLVRCGGRTVWEDRYIGQQCGIWRDEIIGRDK